MKQLQQGDLILTKIESLPDGAIKRKADSRGIVLAEGEATGHFHGIKSTRGVELLERDGTMFLVNSTKRPVKIIHQEHKPVTVDPGIWQIGGVREHDYFQDMERMVRD